MSSTLSTLLEGLLIGAGAGVVSSIILGGFHWVRLQGARRNQVNYLRDCVIDNFSKINTHPDLTGPVEGDPPIMGEQMRPALYELFVEMITVALEHRTNALRNSQLFELHNAKMLSKKHENLVRFAMRTAAAQRGGEPPEGPGIGLPTDISFYRTIYEYFADIKWLQLPKHMPSEPGARGI